MAFFLVLTCHRDRDLLRDDGAHAVPGVALVVPCILSPHGLDLIEVLGRVLGQESPVLHPAVLGLRKAYMTTYINA